MVTYIPVIDKEIFDSVKYKPVIKKRKKMNNNDLCFYNELLTRTINTTDDLYLRIDNFDLNVENILNLENETLHFLDIQYKRNLIEIKDLFMNKIPSQKYVFKDRGTIAVYVAFIILFFNDGQLLLNGILTSDERLILSSIRVNCIPSSLLSIITDYDNIRKILRYRILDITKMASRYCMLNPIDTKQMVNHLETILKGVKCTFIALFLYYNQISGETLSINMQGIRKIVDSLRSGLQMQTIEYLKL